MEYHNNENWNEKICMASLNNSIIRCKKFAIKNGDFCYNHMTKKEYNNDVLQSKVKQLQPNENKYVEKYLDIVIEKFEENINSSAELLNEKYQYSLFKLEDNWKNIPFIYWFYCDGLWWDIRILLQIITMQLNQSESENPYPIYPENPFTRNKICPHEIMLLSKKIEKLRQYMNLNIHISLQIFFQIPETKLNILKNNSSDNEIAMELIYIFKNYLRFKLINLKNSQGLYCGYWVKKHEELSKFEKCYRKIINMGPISYDTITDEKLMRFIFLSSKLDSLENENYEI